MVKKPTYEELEQTLKQLKHGDHLCCIYETKEEHRALLALFVAQGLELNEKVFYIVDDRTAEDILKYLRDEGVTVDAYHEKGPLTILSADEAYMREGTFDLYGMIALLQGETKRALNEGYSGLRVAGEMSWALKGSRGSERLIEYEAKLNEFLAGSKCKALCQYDRRSFGPAILLDVLTTHPIVIIGTEVFDNFYYIPPHDFLGPNPEGARLSNRLKNLAEKKSIEEALRQSEFKFRSLFDLSPQAITLAEVDTGRLIDVNDKFCELTKLAKEEVVGHTTTELGFYSEEDRNRFINELQKSGEVPGLEMDFKLKDGSIINTLMFAKTIQVGNETFILTVFHGVTEQKKLQAQLQQAQKMEAIGTLAGGIAHDFNNILMGIQGYVSLMSLDTDSDHPHFKHLKGIEDMGRRAADLTKHLLGFARGGKYEVKPTDLNNLITKSSQMFGRTKKEITIHRKYQKGIWSVEIDRGQIEQGLLNLYVNAGQAMPGGGDLYLQTENVTLDENYVKPFQVKLGNYVKISVTDTGEGMDEETKRRIFEPFFTTKELGRGTGLGLASAYGIIKNHDGFINVYSEKGKGTTFTIYLPGSEKEIPEEMKLPKEVLRGKETVLLVDDEDMIIDVGESILKGLGYKVMVAWSGKEAIEIYKKDKDKIDMVILDMIMPVMNGGKTYDLLKEINPNIKVLLSSGYSINGQATEIMERGCDGFIQKPFNMKQLSRSIREILDS